MNSRNHPIWEICRILAWGAIGVSALWIFSSNFDETELKALVMILGGGGAASAGITWMKNKAERDEP